MLLIQIIPLTVPMWGVFTDDNGEPRFEQCVGLGLVEFPQSSKRVVSGLCVDKHVEPADLKKDFVSFTHEPSADAWRERCATKRAEITAAAADAGQAKIIVPEPKPIGDWRGN